MQCDSAQPGGEGKGHTLLHRSAQGFVIFQVGALYFHRKCTHLQPSADAHG
jgi:hypothetical protein